MENATSEVLGVIKNMRPPHVLRDVMILISGLSAILYFNFASNIKILYMFRIEGIGRLETDLLALLAAYVLGKILLEIAEVMISILHLFEDVLMYLLDGVPIRYKFRRIKANLAISWRALFKAFIRPEVKLVSPSEVRNEITPIEIIKIISEHPSMADDLERNSLNIIFLRIAFVACMVFGVMISYVYYAPGLFFLLQGLTLERRSAENWNSVYRFLVKGLALKVN